MSEFDEGSSVESGSGADVSGMDDYFGQVELINDDGTPIAQDSDSGIAEMQGPATTVQPEQNQPQQAQSPAPMNPVLKAGLYNESGEFDLAKATEFFKKTGAFKYEKPAAPVPAASAPSGPAATVPAPEESKSWRDEYGAYESNMRANMLGQLEAIWNENIAAGIPQNDPLMLNLQAKYAEQNSIVEAHLQQKRSEFEDKHIESVLSTEKKRISDMETSARAQAIQSTLEQEAGGAEAYQQLMFGAADQTGNFVAGPGAEIINFLYDQQNGGKQQSVEEMQGWWRDFSANEANARTVFKMASAIHLQNNFDSVLAAARNEWSKSAQVRSQGHMRPPGGSGNPAAVGGGQVGGLDPAVARFAGINQPQIM